jgi:hypothetical protein
MTREKTQARQPMPKSRHAEFRRAVEVAEAGGASRSDMVLHLTQRDVADLKRDAAVAVEDISFGGGVMRYIGVRVVTGGVAASALQAGAEAEPAPIGA